MRLTTDVVDKAQHQMTAQVTRKHSFGVGRFEREYETGHAVLDGLKPQWLLANNPPQTGGLHEAFGDLTAIFLTLAQLEQEARALAKIDGCTGGAQCRSAPVGAKACGGPRYWLPYCPLTTDVAALMSKLSVLQGAEQQFNRTYGVVSDCSYVVEPGLTVSGGSCRVR
ncbi:MAG: hypothetical protein AAB289_08415 [Chloroflexota bacterium]